MSKKHRNMLRVNNTQVKTLRPIVWGRNCHQQIIVDIIFFFLVRLSSLRKTYSKYDILQKICVNNPRRIRRTPSDLRIEISKQKKGIVLGSFTHIQMILI